LARSSQIARAITTISTAGAADKRLYVIFRNSHVTAAHLLLLLLLNY